MRLLLPSLACLLLFSGPVSARLGETLEQCAARYGPMIEKREADFKGSDPEIAVFSKSSVTILVEFHKGKAWRIIFRKPALSALEVEALLRAEAGDSEWGAIYKVGDREFRRAANEQRVSVMSPPGKMGVPEANLEVMTREFTTQFHAGVAERTKSLDAVEDAKKRDNPLPGF